MDQQQKDALCQRLDRLERENRRWRVVGIASVAVLGLVVLVGAKESEVADEIRARKFAVVDKDGKARVELGMLTTLLPFVGAQHDWGLRLMDEMGMVRADLTLSETTRGFSSALNFYKENGNKGVIVETRLDGRSSMALSGRGDKARIALTFLRNSKGREPSGGKLIFGEDQPYLMFVKGKRTLGEMSSRMGEIQNKLMWGEATKEAETKKLLEELEELTDHSRVTLLINEQGSPTLTLTDGNGASAVLGHTTLETKRTGVTTKRPSSSLVLFNKKGKVIWSAP